MENEMNHVKYKVWALRQHTHDCSFDDYGSSSHTFIDFEPLCGEPTILSGDELLLAIDGKKNLADNKFLFVSQEIIGDDDARKDNQEITVYTVVRRAVEKGREIKGKRDRKRAASEKDAKANELIISKRKEKKERKTFERLAKKFNKTNEK